ncbi:hypothetical protein [Micromonospora chersina]|uniref:hypothetical protein n=1 Tax=Micromonospora chersina TaxID=47854 RepID=UPI0033E8F72F
MLVWPAAPGLAQPAHRATASAVAKADTGLELTRQERLDMMANLRAEADRRAALTGVGSVCYNVHVQNIYGWLGPYCDGKIAGTTGQNRQLEAMMVSGSGGNVCYEAHVQGYGWMGDVCDGDIAGTYGENRQMEAFTVTAWYYKICYEAHVQNLGWQGQRCDGQIAGTTGQNRQIEAITIDMKDPKF